MAVRRTSVILLLSLIGALVLLAVPTSHAEAHTRLRDIQPADGSRLATAPSAVTMNFTDGVMSGTARVEISGPDGEVPVSVSMSGATVTGALSTAVPPGAYTVAWRVAAADGHPISGTSTFSVLGPPPSSPSPAVSPTGAAPSDASTTSPTTASTGGSTEATPAPVDPLDPAAALDGIGTGTKIAAALGAILAAGAAIGGLLARRRSHPGRPGGESP